jgi:hypothetical protein
MSVRPTHRSRLLVPGGQIEDLALLHCEWALGLDRFAILRESRLAAGVPGDARPVDLIGEHGDRWFFRFSLPTAYGKRTSAVRILPMDEGMVVEHLIVDEDARQHVEPTADSPETTRVLLDLSDVQPAMLRGVAPVVLGEREVPALVVDVLEPRREAPIILVSVDNTTREPLVDPQELSRRLAAMARVVWLSTVSASRRLKDELMARGFSEKFGCFHGGVRILWPGIQKADDPYDHLLLLPVRLYPIPEHARAERIAGQLCEMIAEDEDLRGRLREAEGEAPPRPEPRRQALPRDLWLPRSLTVPAPTPTPAPVPWRSPLAPRARPELRGPAPTSPAPDLTSRAAEPLTMSLPPVSAVEAAAPQAPTPSPRPTPQQTPGPPLFAQAPPDPLPLPAPPLAPTQHDEAEPEPPVAGPRPRRDGQTTWSRLASDVTAAAELADELEDELAETRRDLMDSRKALRRAEQERDEAVEARFTAKTALEALRLAEACFVDRLVVLPSARASAEGSPFRDPGRIFESLALLAFFGRHDGDCEAAFQKIAGGSARWRPRDSPETASRFGTQRTWTDRDGKRKLFRRHITLGHGVDTQRCAQIYYDVASDGRVEVAWVGEHRPTVSEDT